MELSAYIIWNIFITLVLAPIWFQIRQNSAELKRHDILLNKTREEIAKDYVTKKEALSFKVQNVEQRLNEVIKISFGLQKFLSISDDAFELASILYPNYDDWRWNEEMKKQSTKIWSNK